MANSLDLATALFGNKRLENGESPSVKLTTGTAVSDSKDGKVSVVIAGSVVIDDEYDGEAQSNVIELDTNPNVKEGDTVQITEYGGTSNSMVVTGVVGNGDATVSGINELRNSMLNTIKDIEEKLRSRIETAQSTADDAKKVATNYLSYSSSNGLIAGDMTASTLTFNVQITSNAINLRNGSTTIATITKDGLTSKSAITKSGASVYGETVLYSSDTGTTSTVTLSESAANFSYLEIFYSVGINTYQSVKVYSPNSKKVQLQQTFWASGTTTTQTDFETISISGKTISRETEGYIQTSGNSVLSGTLSARQFYISRVVGIK